jgi:hypothetical protein
MQLKDYVQDLIDQKEVTVGASTSPNAGLQIYQNAFPPHNNIGKAAVPNNNNNSKANINPPKPNNPQDNTSAYLNYGSMIGCISQVEPSINVINIRGPNNQCTVTTRRTRVNITGPPTSAPSKAQYDILEHLGNMPAQISILDLLRTSPVFKEILDNAL